ncbi:uncharacterized protein FTOL_01537 [Fusarium torulosum]|uniref:Uncharacterized protein n=1 Tax=Fusarium torulosum TaxID=33205 RepID=A0AAE8M0B4_9HYPO|nr:uncharacterized protein FTOL_01537 [Fusarium torulosum]
MESEWFENEYNTGWFTKPHHYDHYIWLPQFAQPMGKQSSHEDCHWNGHCDAIDCDLSTKGSAWKFLVMNSVTRLWEYFNNANEAIPKVSSLREPLNSMLNAIAIILGVLITAASLGTGTAVVAVVGPAVSGLILVGILHDTTQDVDLGNKIKVEA